MSNNIRNTSLFIKLSEALSINCESYTHSKLDLLDEWQKIALRIPCNQVKVLMASIPASSDTWADWWELLDDEVERIAATRRQLWTVQEVPEVPTVPELVIVQWDVEGFDYEIINTHQRLLSLIESLKESGDFIPTRTYPQLFQIIENYYSK